MCYFLLVVACTYFYTGVVFNSKDIAENMQKQGGFVPGIRPGGETERYLSNVVNRLTLTGSLSLGIIAVLPFIVQRFTHTSSLTLGGLGLSADIELMPQLPFIAAIAGFFQKLALRCLQARLSRIHSPARESDYRLSARLLVCDRQDFMFGRHPNNDCGVGALKHFKGCGTAVKHLLRPLVYVKYDA